MTKIKINNSSIVLLLLFGFTLGLTNCGPEEIVEDCELKKSEFNAHLFDNLWAFPELGSAVGFSNFTSDSCFDKLRINCDNTALLTDLCNTDLNSNSSWSWLKEDKKIRFNHEPIYANRATYFKIKTLTSTNLTAIWYFTKEEEFTKYLEIRYTAF